MASKWLHSRFLWIFETTDLSLTRAYNSQRPLREIPTVFQLRKDVATTINPTWALYNLADWSDSNYHGPLQMCCTCIYICRQMAQLRNSRLYLYVYIYFVSCFRVVHTYINIPNQHLIVSKKQIKILVYLFYLKQTIKYNT